MYKFCIDDMPDDTYNNFKEHIVSDPIKYDGESYTNDLVNHFNAELVDIDDGYVKMNEEDYMMFVLKFGSIRSYKDGY